MSEVRAEAQLALALSLDAGCRFESFLSGPNALAMAVAQAMAVGDGEPQAYLCGGPGRGKTHLLQAACAMAGQCGRRTAYLDAASLVELVDDRLIGFEHLDLLSLDNVSALCRLPGGEIALFELINRLRDGATQLLLAAPAPPADLGLALADLSSRLGWGPVLQLQSLDEAQTLAALRLRANALGLEVSAEVASYMLRRYPRDLPSLIAALRRLDRASLAAQRRVTIPFVREVLG